MKDGLQEEGRGDFVVLPIDDGAWTRVVVMSSSGSVKRPVKVNSAGVAERQAVRVTERNGAVF